MGEEGDKAGKVEQRLRGPGVSSVEVDAVTKTLKDVKGNPRRQDDMMEELRHANAFAMKQAGDRLQCIQCEGRIFEEGQRAEVGDD